MSGGTGAGLNLSGAGVVAAKNTIKKVTDPNAATTSSTTTKATSEIITNTAGSPGAQRSTITPSQSFSGTVAKEAAANAANIPTTSPTSPNQGLDPSMMAAMSAMGQGFKSPEQTSPKGGTSSGAGTQALEAMTEKFNNFKKQAEEQISSLLKGQSPRKSDDKVLAQALEQLKGTTKPESKSESKTEAKPVPQTTEESTQPKASTVTDYDDSNAFEVKNLG